MLNDTGLTINNFLAILIELSFSILFLIIFLIVHYTLINKTTLDKKLNKSKTFSFWYFFIFGAVISLITFAVSQATVISIGTKIGLPITIMGLIISMTLFYNRSIQVGALVPSIIFVIWSYDGFTSFSWDWCARLILVVIIAVTAIAATFFKTKKWPTFAITVLIVVVECIALIFGFKDSEWDFHLVETFIFAASAIVMYWLLNKINNIFSRMNVMAKSNLYTEEGYFIPSTLDEQFNLFLKNRNISQALVVTFDIKSYSKEVLLAIAKKFKGYNSLLFKTQYGTYGVILGDNKYYITELNSSFIANNQTQRKGTDPLAWLEQEIKNFDLIAFVSIYGVHSNDINELISFNQYAIKQFDKSDTTNQVQLFNSNMLNNEIKDEISYAQLEQKINLNEIEVNLEVVELNNKQRFYFPRFYWTKEFTCSFDVISKNLDKNTKSTLLRNLAIKSIETYSMSTNKEYPLLLDYPIYELNNPFFATNQFIKKIELYGIKKENIVLSFNCKKMNIWSNTIISNFKELEHNGIKYMFVDLINNYPLTQLKPELVILDDSVIKNKKKLDKTMRLVSKSKQIVILNK